MKKNKSKYLPCPHGVARTRKSKDGLTAACSECVKQRDRDRANKPHRLAARLKYQKTEKGKAAGNRAKKKYIEKNVIKRAAHILTNNAIRDGKLIKEPCEHCGKKKVHAHHDDYAKPLEIIWLCDKHHSEWHKENGEALNP